jgi:uncharacterized protein YecE (DUF72 family)
LAGVLHVGTSGFAYRPWAPEFYPTDLRPEGMLAYYAERLPAVELNSTYYQHPREGRIHAWLGATPSGFRFCVKAHRFASLRAFATDPEGTLPSLTDRLRPFGDRLGAVLFRVPQEWPRDDERLRRFLAVWPVDLPLCLELQHRSWHVDPVRERLDASGAALCLTDRDDGLEPPSALGGPFAYLRLRREEYEPRALERWAELLAALLVSGRDAYVFFRHDPTGLAPGRAAALAERVEGRLGR